MDSVDENYYSSVRGPINFYVLLSWSSGSFLEQNSRSEPGFGMEVFNCY